MVNVEDTILLVRDSTILLRRHKFMIDKQLFGVLDFSWLNIFNMIETCQVFV